MFAVILNKSIEAQSCPQALGPHLKEIISEALIFSLNSKYKPFLSKHIMLTCLLKPF